MKPILEGRNAVTLISGLHSPIKATGAHGNREDRAPVAVFFAIKARIHTCRCTRGNVQIYTQSAASEESVNHGIRAQKPARPKGKWNDP
jgi:hypothetical protein